MKFCGFCELNLQLLDQCEHFPRRHSISPGFRRQKFIDSSDYFTLSISSPAVDAFRAENMELGEVRGRGPGPG